MASNQFGKIFRITTWGESHGRAIGVVIDGCPAGLSLDENDINAELALRAPGRALTSPRKEPDQAEIYSGLFEGKTTGAPLSILIKNKDADTSQYEPIKHLLRPGHANFTYLEKYGIFDYRGGGRASARETACRVAAGAVAKKLLAHFDIQVCAYLQTVGQQTMGELRGDINQLKQLTLDSPVFCPCAKSSAAIATAIETAQQAGDSLGGVITCITSTLPIGLGDPVYDKLEANLAKAMLSIPATKGFEIGEGFHAASMTGASHNDGFTTHEEKTMPSSNHAGGTLGGISTGLPLLMRVAFKPTSSIKKIQQTVDTDGHAQEFALPTNARHDPCVAIRAVPVVEAMCALVLADAILINRTVKL